MSEQGGWDAIAALLAETGLGANTYDYGRVPGESGNAGSLPSAFALLSLERRYVAPNKATGTGRTGWRASIRFVGSTARNARTVGGWVREALETTPGHGKRITVDGVLSTPLTHESSTAVESDDGMFSGLITYVYAL